MKMQTVWMLVFIFTLKEICLGDHSTKPSSTTSTTSSSNTTNTSVMSTTTSKTSTGSNLMQDLKPVLSFVTGVISSAIIFFIVLCFVAVCKRCEKTNSKPRNKDKNLEVVKSSHDDKMMRTVEEQSCANENTPLQSWPDTDVTSEVIVTALTKEKEPVSKENNTIDAGEMNELQYAAIDFSLLQKRGNDVMPQGTESDYAEIQLKKINEEAENETLEKVAQDGVDQEKVHQKCVYQVKVDENVSNQDQPGQDEVVLDGVNDNSVDGNM